MFRPCLWGRRYTRHSIAGLKPKSRAPPPVAEEQIELYPSLPETVHVPSAVICTFRASLSKRLSPPRRRLRGPGRFVVSRSQPFDACPHAVCRRSHGDGHDQALRTIRMPRQLVQRPVRFGDAVNKGQLLAVIWSKDLGEKKSELVDALKPVVSRPGNRQTLGRLVSQRLDSRTQPPRSRTKRRVGPDRRAKGRTHAAHLAADQDRHR